MEIDFDNIKRQDRMKIASYLANLDDVEYFEYNMSIIPKNFCAYVAGYGVNEYIASKCAMKVSESLSNDECYEGAIHSKHKAVTRVYSLDLFSRSKCEWHVNFIKFSKSLDLVKLFIDKIIADVTHEECKGILRDCRFNDMKLPFLNKIKSELTLDEVDDLIKHLSYGSDKATVVILQELKKSLTL